MASDRNPFRPIRWSSCCALLFGIISFVVGVSEMCVWMAVLGVYGTISKDKKLWISTSYGGASGVGLIFLSSCGLWCGVWLIMTGACGCCIKLGQPSDKNNRTRIVVCIASAFNAVIFCPVQIALYAFLFKPEAAWLKVLDEPVWWTLTFQIAGIVSGVAGFIVCIISMVIASRTKPYAGQARTWNDLDL